MSVSLICWGRFINPQGDRVTVPAPSTNPGSPWLWDFIASEAHELALIGFNRLQLPPASKAQGGDGAGCDGYGIYDPRDLGTKSQQGSIPTRYGNADSLRRLIAVAHSNGLAVDLDIVLHQLIGGLGGRYRYLGADGTTLNGRGKMDPGCFRYAPGAGTQPQDDVPDPRSDSSFGDEKVYQHCSPPRYTITDAEDYGDWLFQTTGADGARIDDVKGLWAPFVSAFSRHGAVREKLIYGEYFDGDPANLNQWATAPPLSGRSGVADFPLHFALQAACNGFTAAGLANPGYAAWNSGLAYTFVDNPDTDTSPGQQVIECKLLAYAILLTIPCQTALIYGKDYFSDAVWPGAYGLKPLLDNLVWINQKFAYGAMTTRWLDEKVVAFERDGDGGATGTSSGLLTAVNFDTWNVRQITCDTHFGTNVPLHDYTGHHADIWTDAQGRASFTLPANAYGAGTSYVCFSRAGAEGALPVVGGRTMQVFFGAADLDIPPAKKSHAVTAGRIFVEGGTTVEFSSSEAVLAALLDGNKIVADHHPTRTGWYTIQVTTLSPAPTPFALAVNYQAPRTI